MPLVLLLAGVVLVVTGVRGTTEQVGALLKDDFTGPGNYASWLVALSLAAAIGYVPGMKPLSNAFLLLIIVAIVLHEGQGFWDQFNSAMKELNT